MHSAELDRDVAGMKAAHQRLLATVGDLSDVQARQPSLLPDWTVGHVLTHVARNADGFIRMLRGAEAGTVLDQYEGGVAGRAADIEAGARRSADELAADVQTSISTLETCCDRADERDWEGFGRLVHDGQVPIAALPDRRWREVEIHHADLGLGYTIDDWPSEWVRRQLDRLANTWASRQPMGMTELPAPVLALPPNRRLAWFVGRLEVDGIKPAGVFG